MKFCAVVVVVCASLCIAKAELTDEQKSKLLSHHKECLESTQVDLELVKKARQGDFHDDAKLKSYAVCIGKKIGFLDHSGAVQKSVLVTKVGAVIGDTVLSAKLADECIEDKGNVGDTTWNIVKCFYEKTPKHNIII